MAKRPRWPATERLLATDGRRTSGDVTTAADDAVAAPQRGRSGRDVTLRIDVITLFPGLFPGPLAESIPGRALASGAAEVHAHDLRTWGLGRHRSVDDYPYGGGAGMLLRPEPVAEALDAVAPAGRRRDRASCSTPAASGSTRRAPSSWRPPQHLVLLCPRYEGIDDRVRSMVDLELSIGDYVLSGGEIPALVVIDAILRLLPGVIDEASPTESPSPTACWSTPSTRDRRSTGACGAGRAAQRPPRRGRALAPGAGAGAHRRVRPDLLATRRPAPDRPDGAGAS